MPFKFAPGTWWLTRGKNGISEIVVCLCRNSFMRGPTDEWVFFQFQTRAGCITTSAEGRFHPNGSDSQFDIIRPAAKPEGM